jgi:hypothetical protein
MHEVKGAVKEKVGQLEEVSSMEKTRINLANPQELLEHVDFQAAGATAAEAPGA